MVVETSSTQSAPNGLVEVVLNENVSTSVNILKLDNNSYLGGDTKNGEIRHSKSERIWKRCGRALLDVSKRPEALGFLEPVDWVKLGIPLYPNIIKNRMEELVRANWSVLSISVSLILIRISGLSGRTRKGLISRGRRYINRLSSYEGNGIKYLRE